jgi:hypothetical protein
MFAVLMQEIDEQEVVNNGNFDQCHYEIKLPCDVRLLSVYQLVVRR